jgi:hypothetical protein
LSSTRSPRRRPVFVCYPTCNGRGQYSCRPHGQHKSCTYVLQADRPHIVSDLIQSIPKEKVQGIDYTFRYMGVWIVLICDVPKCTRKHFNHDPMANDRLRKHFSLPSHSTPCHKLDSLDSSEIIVRLGRQGEEWPSPMVVLSRANGLQSKVRRTTGPRRATRTSGDALRSKREQK